MSMGEDGCRDGQEGMPEEAQGLSWVLSLRSLVVVVLFICLLLKHGLSLVPGADTVLASQH